MTCTCSGKSHAVMAQDLLSTIYTLPHRSERRHSPHVHARYNTSLSSCPADISSAHVAKADRWSSWCLSMLFVSPMSAFFDIVHASRPQFGFPFPI